MKIIKASVKKLNVVLSAYDPALPIDPNTQVESLKALSTIAPRMLISSETVPFSQNAVRFANTGKTKSLKNLFATYIQEFRGNEIVLLVGPEVLIDKGADDVLKMSGDLRLDMTWAGGISINGARRGFILTANVLNYMLTDIPDTLLFTNDWQSWVHNWLTQSIRHRYIDVSAHRVLRPAIPLAAPVDSKGLVATVVETIKDLTTQDADKESLAKSRKTGNKGLKFW